MLRITDHIAATEHSFGDNTVSSLHNTPTFQCLEFDEFCLNDSRLSNAQEVRQWRHTMTWDFWLKLGCFFKVKDRLTSAIATCKDELTTAESVAETFYQDEPQVDATRMFHCNNGWVHQLSLNVRFFSRYCEFFQLYAITLPKQLKTYFVTVWCFWSWFLPREATRSTVLPRQVVCPSVCPSVTLRYRDHIGWNSAKIISRLISLTISLSADPTWRIYSKGNIPKFYPK